MLLIHLLILGSLFAVSAIVLVLMCCAVGARADDAEAAEQEPWLGEPTTADILESWGVDARPTWLAGLGQRDN